MTTNKRHDPMKGSAAPVEMVPIDSIRPDPNNARRHPERNLAALAASLARFGQQRPILVDHDGVIVAGNGFWQAAKAAGATHVSIVRTSLSGQERAAYAIADNRTAELSEWDEKILAAQLDMLGDEFSAMLLLDDAEKIPASALPKNETFDATAIEGATAGEAVGLSFVLMMSFPDAESMSRGVEFFSRGKRKMVDGSRYSVFDGPSVIEALSGVSDE